MFDNIGGKIQGLAKVICWIGIIASIILGIVIIMGASQSYGYYRRTDTGTIFAGIAVIVGGSLLSWVGSFVLYGFGELVENSSIIADKITSTTATGTYASGTTSGSHVQSRPYIGKDPYRAAVEEAERRKGTSEGGTWTCPYCFAKNNVDDKKGRSCGSPRG